MKRKVRRSASWSNKDAGSPISGIYNKVLQLKSAALLHACGISRGYTMMVKAWGRWPAPRATKCLNPTPATHGNPLRPTRRTSQSSSYSTSPHPDTWFIEEYFSYVNFYGMLGESYNLPDSWRKMDSSKARVVRVYKPPGAGQEVKLVDDMIAPN